MHRGRLVIIGMLLLGVFLASVAVWVNYRQGRLALDYWGPDAALLIRDAESVALIRLERAAEAAPADERTWTIAGQTWIADQQVEVSNRIGMLRVREALLDDAAYDWQVSLQDCEPELVHVLVFEEGRKQVEVIFDSTCQRLRSSSDSRPDVSIAPTSAFFARWMQEQFPPER